MEELKRVQNGFMISCIDQKSCAVAISSGQHLIDSEGNELTTIQSLGESYTIFSFFEQISVKYDGKLDTQFLSWYFNMHRKKENKGV